ncbi:Neuronal pentraxin-1 [Desmophyllum pertusum]|uniref:Pentraxin family member n=1 Tax=Desmophyllum pertusum TaxID=174260 RepID=A0A9W9ZIU4_9CNID|nr:Neuronal pentraxin-1 [Desmophyllum pertusum]
MPCVKAYRMTFPRISTSDYAMKANAIGSSLSAFTVCFFVKLKDPDTPSSALTVYSYAASASPSGNGIYVCLSSPNIAINIGTPKQIDEIKTNSKIEDDQWHHVCVTWENSKGEWQLYMDGQLKENGTGMMKDHHNPSGGTVVFGQDQDSVGGGFETGDAFGPGELTEVNLWGKVLSASDISAQHANCTITQASLVHWWDQFKGGVHGEVQVEEP